jgi:hypothetical protein
MKQSDLKKGLEFSFSTPKNIDDLRIAEVTFSDKLNKFCIMFNGQLFTFKTFSGMKKKLDNLIKKWDLEDITDSVREQNSNANLIEAAPELLNSLKQAFSKELKYI